MMKLRRKIALATGALLFTVPALTACGFDYATDRYYTPAVGANNRDGQVDVLAAVVVASQDGSGRFIASLSNNSTTDTISFDGVKPGEGASLQISDVEAHEIAPLALVNLVDEPAIEITGDFKQGDFVPVVLTFSNGESVAVKAPVVANTGDYEGIDEGGAGTGTTEPSEEPTEETSGH